MPGAPVVKVRTSCPVVVMAALVAKSVRLKAPVTSGIPEITPFVGSRLSPPGKLSIPNVMGVVPVAVLVKLKNVPCFPAALAALVIVGGTSTVSVATELVTEPTMFVMNTLYPPASLVVAAAMVRVLLVAPLMSPPFDRGVPSFSQRKLNGALPLGVTLKLALLPVRMVKLAGGTLMPGGANTLSVATWLVAA